MLKHLRMFLLLGGMLALLNVTPAQAQAATRPVLLTWPASSTTGVTGYIILTGTSVTGPFTQLLCTGTVPGSTCVSGSTANTLTAMDPSETVGTTVYYEVESWGPNIGAIATQATQATVGSTTITIVAANSAIVAGATVTGTGIASGTTVTAVSGTTVTLSTGITAALNATSVTFSTTTFAASLPLQCVYPIPPKTQTVISTTLAAQ